MKLRFDHERLEVYQVARQFNREVKTLLDELPRGFAESKDNLRRSAMSITRNLAEGSGKWKISDKAHFYQIARGSATEATACLEELVDYGAITSERVSGMQDLLGRIIAMAISLIRSLEEKRAERG